MRPVLSACEKCGLRGVRHELEKKGVFIRFCNECYWSEIEEKDAAGSAEVQASEPAPSAPAPM